MENYDTTKKYYKGNLVLLGKKNLSSEKLIASYNYLEKKLIFKEKFTEQEKMILSRYLNAIMKSCRATRRDIVEIFSKLFDKDELSKLNIETTLLPIIYTKENGVARELHSNEVFPILSNDDVDLDYFIEVEDYPKESISNYKVSACSRITYPNSSAIKVSVVDSKEASIDEVINYLKMFKKLIGVNNKKKLEYQEKIASLANKNGSIKANNQSIRQDLRLSLMEKVEYELAILGSKNLELYKELNNSYQKLKNFITIEGLIGLLNEMEVIKTFNLNYRSDILGYIGRCKEKYLLDFKNNLNNTTNMSYIEEIARLFYKQQNSYSAMEKRTAEVDLAYIYLIEVYRNREILDINSLENSYFKELLKTIVLCLKALEKEAIITLDEINLEDELKVQKVFDYIKSIEIKEHSKNK